jgi:hypothetical protein
MHAIDKPEILAEVKAAFARYETALAANDVETLNALFWRSPRALRYGTAENLYGYADIAAFRGSRAAPGPRSLSRTVITTYGDDFATANTEFRRAGNPRLGRQSQAWLRTPEGWRIVSAHVSFMD